MAQKKTHINQSALHNREKKSRSDSKGRVYMKPVKVKQALREAQLTGAGRIKDVDC